jgi:hypothetical protein
MFIVNAPRIFTLMWKFASRLVNENTAKKIHIYSKDYQALLLEHIDANKLPKILGGTCECTRGCMYSDIGPWNPEGHSYDEFGVLKGRTVDPEAIKQLPPANLNVIEVQNSSSRSHFMDIRSEDLEIINAIFEIRVAAIQ